MRKDRPSLFVGSSTEGLPVAQAIRENLNSVCEAKLWTEGIFKLGQFTLESLLNCCGRFDFAVIVLTADDEIQSRGERSGCPRDNVLIEFGMFLGSLGRERTFFICDGTEKIKLPSDLAGLAFATYEPHKTQNLVAALRDPCTLIVEAVRRIGARSETPVSPEQEPPTDTTVSLMEDEVKYLLDISKPRNKGQVAQSFIENASGREAEKYYSMLEGFVEKGYMRDDGSFYCLTTPGWEATDELWKSRIETAVAASVEAGGYVIDTRIAEAVGLTDGDVELQKLRRLLDDMIEAERLEVDSGDGRGVNVRLPSVSEPAATTRPPNSDASGGGNDERVDVRMGLVQNVESKVPRLYVDVVNVGQRPLFVERVAFHHDVEAATGLPPDAHREIERSIQLNSDFPSDEPLAVGQKRHYVLPADGMPWAKGVVSQLSADQYWVAVHSPRGEVHRITGREVQGCLAD